MTLLSAILASANVPEVILLVASDGICPAARPVTAEASPERLPYTVPTY